MFRIFKITTCVLKDALVVFMRTMKHINAKVVISGAINAILH